MIVSPLNHWLDTNQHYLMAALAEVRQILRRAVSQQERGETLTSTELEAMAAGMQIPPALETLCQIFGLSPFERQVLLLCAGVELDGEIASLCAQIQGDNRRNYATFSVALAVLPEPNWSAIYPASPLRHWRLVEVGNSDGITRSHLRIDERVLHYLTGGRDLDERLVGLLKPIPVASQLVLSHRALAERLVTTWSRQGGTALTVLQLCGKEGGDQRAIASVACNLLGINLYLMSAQVVPLDAREQEAMMRLWEREAALTNSALMLDCRELNTNDAAREHAIERLITGLRVRLIVASRERRSWGERPTLTIDVQPPTTEEQYSLWQKNLGTEVESLNGAVSALVSQYNLSAPTIHAVCAEALGELAAKEQGSNPPLIPPRGERAGEQGSEISIQHQIPSNPPYQGGDSKIQNLLWDLCRTQSRPRLEDLAQRIEPAATWKDLVLPQMQQQLLREIAVHVQQRLTVYEDWGFASKGARGLGISALFSGLSGTGKTMAAEVLANELRLDLYRIDLSSVVSKYIGETEKNLRWVFDAAEQGGAILLFDEADALFGKRSEVKDSHDRYANIEVSYLLQRMEAYRGLAILTTNLKNALDTAFMRRLRFIVQFPFPDAAQRAEIWRRIFPADTPTEGLDVEKLARLNIAGGNIRNMALYAAFLAAEAKESVKMPHLLRAAQVEFAKFEKSLTEAEVRGWV